MNLFDDYKQFLKENQESVFTIVTGAFSVMFFFGLLVGTMVTITSIDRSIRNAKELADYRKDLETYQQCAAKIQDSSTVSTYCGESPSRPTLLY